MSRRAKAKALVACGEARTMKEAYEILADMGE